jgi:endonuclease/exonuclease/phosphatase family metal-dependent hydrolase
MYSTRHRFTAVTFDTSSCRNDYRTRIDVMTQALISVSPDILLLQNVFATADNRHNTAAHIARALHMQCAFLPVRPKIRYLDGRPTQSHSGLAILSRHTIIDAGRIELPCDPRDGERIAQFVDLDLNGMRLMVANTQLSHLAGADAVRRHQIEKLAERLADAHDFDHILVGGDFNAGPDEPALAPIREMPGFTIAEAAPERCVDRLFALTRRAAYRPIAPMTLAETRLGLDGLDPATNLFPAERAALVCDMALGAAQARLTPLAGLPRWAKGGQARHEATISALHTAAE